MAALRPALLGPEEGPSTPLVVAAPEPSAEGKMTQCPNQFCFLGGHKGRESGQLLGGWGKNPGRKPSSAIHSL